MRACGCRYTGVECRYTSRTSEGAGKVGNMKKEKLVAAARKFLDTSSIATVTVRELDQAVALIREMADALDVQPVARFANDEYLGRIRVEDNSRTALGKWSTEDTDPDRHFHIWSDAPCKGGAGCPADAAEREGDAR